MKRWISWMMTFVLITVSTLGLSGCSKEKLTALTKGEWVQKIASTLQMEDTGESEPVYSDVKSDNTYFSAVQSCAAWDILDKSDKFEPDRAASVDFAIETAVKAIGLDNIANSSYGKTLQTEEDRLEYFRSISDVKYISGGALYEEWADKILSDMNTAMSGLEFKQVQDVEFADGCIEIEPEKVQFKMDGETGILLDDSVSVKEGTILIVNPCTIYPDGKAVKVNSIQSDSQKGKVFTYTSATEEEVLKNVKLSGTYKPELIGVIPASDDVEVSFGESKAEPQAFHFSDAKGRNPSQTMLVPASGGKAGKTEASVGIDDINFKLKGWKVESESGDSKGTASVNVGVKNISVTTDIELSLLKVKKAYARIDSTLFANFKASGSCSPDPVNLATMKFAIWGPIVLDVKCQLVAGASGEFSIEWSLPTSVGVQYKDGCSPQFIKNQKGSQLDAEAHGEAYINPGVVGTFECATFAVASAGIYSGLNVKIDAKGQASKNGAYYCLNLKGYVPLYGFVGGQDKETLLAKLGAKKDFTIWDEGSSPVKKEWHIENNKLVDKCTHPEDQPEITPMPLEEYEAKEIELPDLSKILKDLAKIGSHYLGVTDGYYSMEQGQTDQVHIDEKNLPDGYSRDDIVFSVKDGSIASVNKAGKVTANREGTTTLTVSTKDKKYQEVCVINVLVDYSTDFEGVNPVGELYGEAA